MNANETISTAQKFIDALIAFCVSYGLQVLGALIVLGLGVIAGNWAAGILGKFLQKKNLDITLSKFLISVVKLIILGFAMIVALGKFGISTSPLVAALSAAVFGASFALKGPLSNYGAGLSIILSRPFKVGETITVRDVSGVVEEVKLACTRLVNEDGIIITIPNNQIVGEILHNSKLNRVVESSVGISYDADPEKAIQVITEVLSKYPEIVKQPGAQIGIASFGDFAINIGYRYWVPTTKYFHISYSVNLGVYRALKESRINIPFPQQEVRILSQV